MNRKARNNKKRWFVYDAAWIGIVGEYSFFSFYRDPNNEESRVDANRKAARLHGRWGVK